MFVKVIMVSVLIGTSHVSLGPQLWLQGFTWLKEVSSNTQGDTYSWNKTLSILNFLSCWVILFGWLLKLPVKETPVSLTSERTCGTKPPFYFKVFASNSASVVFKLFLPRHWLYNLWQSLHASWLWLWPWPWPSQMSSANSVPLLLVPLLLAC